MAEGSHPAWRTRETRDLLETIVSLKTVGEAERFFRDLCTLSELEAMAHRWQAAEASETRPDRLTIAIPAKGRLREPAVALLEDAGLGPEQPGERALAFPCRNAPVDVLLVRAADVPEYVQDGVVDCGVTGADLVRERGADVEEL